MENILNHTEESDNIENILDNEFKEEAKLIEHMKNRKSEMNQANSNVSKEELFDVAKKEFSTLMGALDTLVSSYDDISVKVNIVNRDHKTKLLNEASSTLTENQPELEQIKNSLRGVYTKLTSLVVLDK